MERENVRMYSRVSWLRRYQRYFLVALFLLLDYLAVVFAEHLALALRNALAVYWQGGHYVLRAVYLYFWVPLIFLLFLGRSQVYQQMRPILDTIRDIFYSVVCAVVATVILLYVFRGDLQVSRLYLVLFSVLVLLLLYMFRYVTLKLLKVGHLLEEPVILIGAGKTAECLLRFFAGDLGFRYHTSGSSTTHRSPRRWRGGFCSSGAWQMPSASCATLACRRYSSLRRAWNGTGCRNSSRASSRM